MVEENSLHTQPGKDSGSTAEWISVAITFRKFIIVSLLLAAIVSTIVTLLLPGWYSATAWALPAGEAGLTGTFDGSSSPVGSFLLSKITSFIKSQTRLRTSDDIDRCLAILKSRSTLSAVVGKFDLIRVYGITSYPMENAIEELLRNVEFEAHWEGSLSVTVYDTDPRRAAEMANYFLELVNATELDLRNQYARRNARYVEEHYMENQKNLKIAEDSLLNYQRRSGIVEPEEQRIAQVSILSEAEESYIKKEVEVGALKKKFSPDHPSVIQAEKELNGRRSALVQIKSGQKNRRDDVRIYPSFGRIPDADRQYSRRNTALDIQDTVAQWITPLYREAVAQEYRNIPLLVVYDRAIPPDRESRPLRILIIIGGMLLGGAGAFMFAFIYEQRIKESGGTTSFIRSLFRLIRGIRNEVDGTQPPRLRDPD